MDFVKQLKEQINIADVVGEYVRLRKTGSNYMGLCPFHAERSPSFSVTDKRQIYHCFGCQRSGDVISFIQEIQAVSFHEAIRMLAHKFGIKLPPEFAARGKSASAQPAADKLEVYYKLNDFVAQFYHMKLLSPEGKAAREYLEGRGVTEATIKSAKLGYAPNAWAELYDFLDSKKAPLDKAEELGLIRRKEGGADSSGRAHFDLFRSRVMFPVTDLRGRVIAFGGRAVGDNDGPKYLNSTESPIFKKGSHLFGIFFAQKEIRAEDRCVVVEGFMDCLALQQEGIGYAVATLGTALTEKQVGMLKRFTRNIIVLFDGDSAGQEAQARAMETFLNEDVVVRGVSLADEYDPDEFVREKGAAALDALLANAPYLLDQRILELASQAGGHAEARARAVDQALPWVAKISSETARLVRVQELSGLFDMPIEVIERRLAQLRTEHSATRKVAAQARPPAPVVVPARAARPQQPRAEMVDALDAKLLEIVVQHPALFNEAGEREEALHGLETEAARDLALKLLGLPQGAQAQLGAEALDWASTPALKTITSRALMLAEQEQTRQRTPEEADALKTEIKDLVRKLVRRGLERRKDSLRADIRKAEGSGQQTEYSRLMNEYHELARRLDETKFKEVR
ncbi:MAG: DNA primase [Deltaproteobacteria bacterium]|nr:DNA primase [Deltaproteobacteria bacterium]